VGDPDARVGFALLVTVGFLLAHFLVASVAGFFAAIATVATATASGAASEGADQCETTSRFQYRSSVMC
jgi:hypothetical protein